MNWKIEYDGYKGIIGIEDAPTVVNAVSKGLDKGMLREKEWRIKITDDEGKTIKLSECPSSTRESIADSVARKIVEQSRKHDEKIRKLRESILER